MSGGSGLRRFAAGAARSTSTNAAMDAGAAQAQPAVTDARATLEAALGRPLEQAGQVSAGTGAGTGTGTGTDTGTGTGTEEIEKCELCSTVIPAEHGHLADLESSSLMCACRACYLLFTRSEAAFTRSDAASTRSDAIRGRYRAIPDRYLTDPEHPISTADWEALEIPVGLAFFLNDSRTGHVTGFYPSPAGATECRLDLQAWNELAATHPLLAAAEPDVEAILISRPDPRTESRTVDSFIVPIDACYELAGRMRLYWRGFDGGSEAKASIGEFLDKVTSRSRLLDQSAQSQGA